MTFIGLPYWLWAIVCLGVAAVYAFVGPHPVSQSGPLAAAVRWLHSATWVLLAAAASWVAATGDTESARVVAWLGLGVYVLWLGAVAVDRVRSSKA